MFIQRFQRFSISILLLTTLFACGDQGDNGDAYIYRNPPGPEEEFIPNTTLIDDNGIVYLLSTDNNRIFRWSAVSKRFINPIHVGSTDVPSSASPTLMAYSSAHQRLYLGYPGGAISYIDLTGRLVERPFTSLPLTPGGLAAVGQFVLAQDDSGAWKSHYIFDVNGILTDSVDWNYYSRVYTWNDVNNRVYFFRDGTGPNDLHYEEINQTSGTITAEDETPYHGDYVIAPPIRISQDGSKVLLGSGDIYDANSLNWVGALGGTFDDAIWMPDGSLITLKTNAGETVLQRRDTSLNTVVEQLGYDGTQLAIFEYGSQYIVVTQGASKPIFYIYQPNNDSDGDGVTNLNDAFPLDAAASVDTDGDGYPDSWNSGYTQANSTTGLSLDAYPDDSACYLPVHGDGVTCDVTSTMPVFTPDATLIDDNGIVYLLSTDNNRIFRWSAPTESFINSIHVGSTDVLSSASPTLMAYSRAHQRLYLGYPGGAITFIDLTGSLVEQPFTNLPLTPGGLAAVGEFMLAQGASGVWGTHYIFDVNGILTDSVDWNYYSRVYAWSEVNDRVYFFSDGMNPNDLHYEDISQVNGTITADGETPYHGDYVIAPPIRISQDGSKVLLGSGDIYDANSLNWVSSLGAQFVDAVWFSDVLVLATSNDIEDEIQFWDADKQQVLSRNIVSGTTEAILLFGTDVVRVATDINGVNLSILPIGDHDGDGLPAWWEITYGLNDADSSDAALDSDTDGLTNVEEFSHLSDPTVTDTDNDGLSDGEEVYTYFTNPVASDTDSDGLTDSEEILVYLTDPTLSDTDSDGYSDGDEINLYGTNPLDGSSVPAALANYSESFEGGAIPAIWIAAATSNADWILDNSVASDGTQSLRSGVITHNQNSGIEFTVLLAAGTLSYSAWVDAEACCDKLEFYVDGVMVHNISSNGGWTTYQTTLTNAEHTLEWRYRKDVSVSTGADAVWIDSITFN